MRSGLAGIVVLAFVVAACGGTSEDTTSTSGQSETTTTASEEAATTTPSEPETTTTAAAPTTTARTEQPTSQIDPLTLMSQECIDLFVEYIQSLEPHLGGLNPRFLTQEELEAMTAVIDPIQADYDAQVASSDCPQTDLRSDRDLISVMLDITAAEAPGALPMMGWVADLAGYYDEVPDISTGACDADLATLQEIIADYPDGPRYLTMGDFVDLENLANSLEQICADRLNEYLNSADYQDWASQGLG